MDRETIESLNLINKNFYKKTAEDFSDSRKYYWQGWREFLPYIENMLGSQDTLSVLDVGCGNGRFGSFLVDYLPLIEIKYLGIDGNRQLLGIAESKLKSSSHLDVRLQETDIVEALLDDTFLQQEKELFDVIVMFGVLHHIPSFPLRKKLIQSLGKKTSKTGLLIFTLWRFLDSARLQSKLVEFETAGLSADQLDTNDYLLSWERGERSFRYGHYTDQKEENALLAASKLNLVCSFESDGKEGKGNKYLVLSQASGV